MPKAKTIQWSARDLAERVRNLEMLGEPRRWHLARVGGKKVLFSARHAEGGELEIDCPLVGRYEVTIDYFSPVANKDQLHDTLALEMEGVLERTVPLAVRNPDANGNAQMGSFYVGILQLQGAPLRISKVGFGALAIAGIRFAGTRRPRKFFERGQRPAKPMIWGITDQLDHGIEIGSTAMRDNASMVRYHRELGFSHVSWHTYGGNCMFPSRKGDTFIPVDLDNREHLKMLVDHKRPPYRDVLMREGINRYDMVDEGQRLAHKEGLAFMPCMRINNEWLSDWCFQHGSEEFMRTFWAPDFMKENERFWQQYKSGDRYGGGMDFSYSEVRRYRLAIVEEVIRRYALIDGCFLDLHRHPPMVNYPDAVVEAFRKKTGIDVREVEGDADVTDPRWHAFRARYFTKFMRSIKKLRTGLKWDKPLVARVGGSLESALHEGADLDAWIKEGLVDILICEVKGGRPDEARLGPIIEKCRPAGIKVLGSFAGPNFIQRESWKEVSGIMDRWMSEGADGVTFYESNRIVCQDALRKHLPDWVRAQASS